MVSLERAGTQRQMKIRKAECFFIGHLRSS